MFTDEVGDNLEEVKKYDEAEPINIPDKVISELNTAQHVDVQDKFNNVENSFKYTHSTVIYLFYLFSLIVIVLM